MAAVTICSDFGAQENKVVTVSIVSPSICHEVMEPNAMILVFWMLSFKPTFSLSLSLSSGGFLVPLHFLPYRWCHLHTGDCWYFFQQSWFQLVIHPAQHFAIFTLQYCGGGRVAIPFSRESSLPRDWTQVSCIAETFLPCEPSGKQKVYISYSFLRCKA